MEPFGLLNFLQTLLNNNAFSQNQPQTNAENKENPPFSSNTFSANSAQNSMRNPSQNSMQNETATASKNVENNLARTEETPPVPNAFAQFLENHDTRVKNTKKR